MAVCRASEHAWVAGVGASASWMHNTHSGQILIARSRWAITPSGSRLVQERGSPTHHPQPARNEIGGSELQVAVLSAMVTLSRPETLQKRMQTSDESVSIEHPERCSHFHPLKVRYLHSDFNEAAVLRRVRGSIPSVRAMTCIRGGQLHRNFDGICDGIAIIHASKLLILKRRWLLR